MKLLDWILDLFYPPKCILCHKLLQDSTKTICPDCYDDLPNFDGPEPSVHFAERCVVTFWYEKSLRDSFLRYKFSGLKQYADVYGRWMAVTVRDKLAGEYDLVTWVPVSKRRRRTRGYDQAELLCRALCRHLGCEAKPTLIKTVDNPAQSASHGASQRAANVLGVYTPLPEADLLGKRILLIDDIVTTGATLGEACRVLKTAGAASVLCAAFASPRDNHVKEEPL